MGSEKHRRADHVRNEFRGKIGRGNLDKRKLLSTTLTLLNAIAALAMMGESSQPVSGNSTPAAMGMPTTL